MLELSRGGRACRRPTSCASPSTTTRGRSGRTRACPHRRAGPGERDPPRHGADRARHGAGRAAHSRSGLRGLHARRRRHAGDSGGSRGKFALQLDAAVPADADGDDVPDAIDDCPAVANPGRAAARAMSTAAAAMAAWTPATSTAAAVTSVALTSPAVTTAALTSVAATMAAASDAFSCEVGRVQPRERRGVHRQHAVHLQLLRRRRLLHERLHRPVPVVQPAEPRRNVPALRAGERIPPSNAPRARPATARARAARRRAGPSRTVSSAAGAPTARPGSARTASAATSRATPRAAPARPGLLERQTQARPARVLRHGELQPDRQVPVNAVIGL